MLSELKPFFTLLISTVVGFLVAHGSLDPNNTVNATQSLNDLIGGFILIVTAVSALHRYVIHHPVATTNITESNTVSTTPVVTDSAVQVTSTPIPQNTPVDTLAVG